jgi:hypothetical protein
MSKCKHGKDLGKVSCWCTFRKGNYGLLNGQMVEFEDDKIKRYIPKKERILIKGGPHHVVLGRPI